MFYIITPGLGLLTPQGLISYSDDPEVKEFNTSDSALDFAKKSNLDNHLWVCQDRPFKQLYCIDKTTKEVKTF